jgi:hypothetical protein
LLQDFAFAAYQPGGDFRPANINAKNVHWENLTAGDRRKFKIQNVKGKEQKAKRQRAKVKNINQSPHPAALYLVVESSLNLKAQPLAF